MVIHYYFIRLYTRFMIMIRIAVTFHLACQINESVLYIMIRMPCATVANHAPTVRVHEAH